ncbi:DUF4917 family protein [Nocardioides seonyuensis]|uniref:DUF4917 family protein n=1 Tax=Nocardioides seonyuensis TaxID=2518371 RepID=UPI0014207D9B|nr:DUF4917 family protein [Nocardioides seonyuensis]
MRAEKRVTDELPDWQTYSSDEWPTLLIGNGLSINLWSGFAYDSLFSEASDQGDLAGPAESIFDELDTTNFETVLECLHHARIVLKALGDDVAEVEATYGEVRDALLSAVSAAHVDWNDFPVPTHTAIATSIAEHDNVFTTNYDLCVYWSLLQSDPSVNTKDYFWNPGHDFDPANTNATAGTTLIHYLHGALHLWQSDSTGIDGKWTNADGGNLTRVLRNYSATSDKRPLFVSEGNSASKVRTISRSAYLSFCLDRLRDDEQNTVVFGHSLSTQDEHIIEALLDGKRKKIAVALRPSSRADAIIATKSRIIEALPGHTILFFDSTTHPLGDRTLNIG